MTDEVNYACPKCGHEGHINQQSDGSYKVVGFDAVSTIRKWPPRPPEEDVFAVILPTCPVCAEKGETTVLTPQDQIRVAWDGNEKKG
ncbi:MAG: hypothetical protein HYU58_09010 [Proteobacteria bacterium]|nr:hypothetical protein [Pseudomonadota bacterium]